MLVFSCGSQWVQRFCIKKIIFQSFLATIRGQLNLSKHVRYSLDQIDSIVFVPKINKSVKIVDSV